MIVKEGRNRIGDGNGREMKKEMRRKRERGEKGREEEKRKGTEEGKEEQKEEYSIRHNKIEHQHETQTLNQNTTYFKLHHSTLPSDSLCGVRLFLDDWEEGKRIGDGKIG